MKGYFYLKQNKKVKQHNIGIYSVMGVIVAIFIALFVISSWYKYDKGISEFFYKAMDNDFIKGWAAYTCLDGYIVIISFIVPIAFMIVEGFFIYLKNKTKHYKRWMTVFIKWFYIVGLSVYVIACIVSMYMWLFADHGFGPGFSYWFIAGWEYTIPIFVVSLLVNFAICFSLSWWVHYRVLKRKDFLETGLWKKSILVMLFLAFTYIPMMILKAVYGRPYLININWSEWLEKIKTYDPSRYDTYVNQDTWNFGWISDKWLTKEKADGHYYNGLSFPTDEQDWPWWKVGRGYFYKPTYWANLPSDDYSFPSGHVDEVMIIGLSMLTLFGSPKTRKQETLRLVFFGLSVLYLADMFFALEVSLNHWTSDMAFSISWAPIAYLLGWLLYEAVVKIINKIKK